MKKIISLLLVVILSFGLVACGASKTEIISPIVGTWESEAYGLTMIYMFEKDGTYENFIDSSSIQGTEGTYVFDEEAGTLSLTHEEETNTMEIKINGDVMVLTFDNDDGTHRDTIFKRQQ